MQYLGGKSRIAREIAEILSNLRGGGRVYQLVLRLVCYRVESQGL